MEGAEFGGWHDVWQDREIRFDVPAKGLEYRRGEQAIDSINSVEDTKGNNGQRGSLVVTNLRLIWMSHRSKRTNLSIGYNCAQNISIRAANSRLRGSTQALYIMTRFNNSRFEFIFTSLVRASPRLFTTVQAVFRAYDTTKLYRELKLRGAIIKDKQLLMLPDEQVYNKIDGVWNLSSDQGNLGTFFITNVRVVWHANLAENFNVSMPYMQMKSVRVRNSKFGQALVVETSPKSGGYILGFRVHPAERLTDVLKEITSVHRVFSADPVFGVNFKVDEVHKPLAEVTVRRVEDKVEITDVDHVGALSNAVYRAYYASADKGGDRRPVLNPKLGLAMETPPDGISIDMLWSMTS